MSQGTDKSPIKAIAVLLFKSAVFGVALYIALLAVDFALPELSVRNWQSKTALVFLIVGLRLGLITYHQAFRAVAASLENMASLVKRHTQKPGKAQSICPPSIDAIEFSVSIPSLSLRTVIDQHDPEKQVQLIFAEIELVRQEMRELREELAKRDSDLEKGYLEITGELHTSFETLKRAHSKFDADHHMAGLLAFIFIGASGVMSFLTP
jgi:hypothetical protein